MEKGTTIKVLDHGYVKFIDSMGTDETIVEAARMSTGKGFISWDPYWRCKVCGAVTKPMSEAVEIITNTEPIAHGCGGVPLKSCIYEKYPDGDKGLLDNLWRNKHATPFEMVELSLEVQAPIMVFREWHRHRTQSFNEFSARYAQMTDLHYIPELERIVKQSTLNKQGSDKEMMPDAAGILAELERQQTEVYGYYDAWVGNGMAKEVARLNTPVSRYSKMRVKTDLRNWLAFCNLRMRPGAQWEIRQFANEVGKIINIIWPQVWHLFEEYDLYGCYLSRTELNILRRNVGIGSLELDAQGDGLSGTKMKEFIRKIEQGGKTIL